MQDLKTGFQASPPCLLSCDPSHIGLRFAVPGLPGPESSLGSYLWLQEESRWVLSHSAHYSGLTLGPRPNFSWLRRGSGCLPRQPLILTPCKDREAHKLSLQCKRLSSESERLCPVRGEGPRLGLQ